MGIVPFVAEQRPKELVSCPSTRMTYIISGGTGGPADSVLFYTLYLYQQAFSNFRMGYASAMAWILLAIIGISSAVAFLSSRYWVYYEDETR